MKLMKDLAPSSGNKAAPVLTPYSRLNTHIACLALCGWMVLDAHHAA